MQIDLVILDRIGAWDVGWLINAMAMGVESLGSLEDSFEEHGQSEKRHIDPWSDKCEVKFKGPLSSVRIPIICSSDVGARFTIRRVSSYRPLCHRSMPCENILKKYCWVNTVSFLSNYRLQIFLLLSKKPHQREQMTHLNALALPDDAGFPHNGYQNTNSSICNLFVSSLRTI
jgi:hypothetical protein